MTFELHPGAERDLESAIDFYLKNAGPVIAERFLEEFYRAAKYLVENPDIISTSENGHRSYPLHVFPYSVVYVIPERKVRILVVRHHRRKPSYGSRRT